jgi:uncharacterized protein YcfJ
MTHATQSQSTVRVGIFGSVASADAAIVRLINAGFTKEQITVVAPRRIKDHFAPEHPMEPGGSHTAGAVAVGGAIGAVLGGVIAAAAIIGTGATALIVAGPLVAAAAGGAAAGGFIGAMMTRGVEREAAQFYDQAVRDGKILVGVAYTGADQRARLTLVERVLNEAGAEPLPLQQG